MAKCSVRKAAPRSGMRSSVRCSMRHEEVCTDFFNVFVYVQGCFFASVAIFAFCISL